MFQNIIKNSCKLFKFIGEHSLFYIFREAVDSSVDEVENEKVDKITNKEHAEVPYTVVERIVYVRKPFLIFMQYFLNCLLCSSNCQ